MRNSPVIVGTMRLGKWGAGLSTSQWLEFIESCLEMGLHEFDHADIYGHYTTEADFGAALKDQPSLRDHLHLTTKCGIKLVSANRPAHRIKSYDLSRRHIVASVENSLLALHTDRLDLLLLHRPDLLMDPDEIAEACESLQNEGKVREFGVSNFRPAQLDLIHDYLPLSDHQMEISLLRLDAFGDGTLDQCMARGIAVTAWSPLGGGRFFTEPETEKHARIREAAEAIGRDHGASFDQIMLAFLARHPVRIRPVLGTARIERLRKAKAAMEIRISREEWYSLWKASTGAEIA